MHQLRLFFIALQFFTRIPIPQWVGFEAAWLQQASRYFPAVGWVVAAWTALVYSLALIIWPQPVAVVLSTAAGIWLTGAFHEDGFADVCDGFGGGLAPDRVLEIMKDSRVGAYGAIGIAMLLLVKCTVLASLPAGWVVFALAIAHPLSRLMAVSLIWRLEYARQEGKAKPLAQHMSHAEFILACLSVLLPIGVLLVWKNFLLLHFAVGLLLLVLAGLWLARLFVRRIAGYTGDCLGAVQQVSELAFYLGFSAAIARTV
ncbi:MAG: adenosylcobinamide-GDP ribazoletransferase [Pseudomonadota bacterium]